MGEMKHSTYFQMADCCSIMLALAELWRSEAVQCKDQDDCETETYSNHLLLELLLFILNLINYVP